MLTCTRVVVHSFYVCLLIGQSQQIPQRGIYEPAREVKDYAAFAPPATGGQ